MTKDLHNVTGFKWYHKSNQHHETQDRNKHIWSTVRIGHCRSSIDFDILFQSTTPFWWLSQYQNPTSSSNFCATVLQKWSNPYGDWGCLSVPTRIPLYLIAWVQSDQCFKQVSGQWLNNSAWLKLAQQIVQSRTPGPDGINCVASFFSEWLDLVKLKVVKTESYQSL